MYACMIAVNTQAKKMIEDMLGKSRESREGKDGQRPTCRVSMNGPGHGVRRLVALGGRSLHLWSLQPKLLSRNLKLHKHQSYAKAFLIHTRRRPWTSKPSSSTCQEARGAGHQGALPLPCHWPSLPILSPFEYFSTHQFERMQRHEVVITEVQLLILI